MSVMRRDSDHVWRYAISLLWFDHTSPVADVARALLKHAHLKEGDRS